MLSCDYELSSVASPRRGRGGWRRAAGIPRSSTTSALCSSTASALSSSAPGWSPLLQAQGPEPADQVQRRQLLVCRRAERKSCYSVESTLERWGEGGMISAVDGGVYAGASRSLENLIREAQGRVVNQEEIYMDMRGAGGQELGAQEVVMDGQGAKEVAAAEV